MPLTMRLGLNGLSITLADVNDSVVIVQSRSNIIVSTFQAVGTNDLILGGNIKRSVNWRAGARVCFLTFM